MSSADAESISSVPPAARGRATGIRRSPRDFLDMFFERWWVGALVGLLAAGAVVYYRPHFEPIFRTEVSLLFEARKDRVLNIQEVVDTSIQTAGELNTHMEQIRSNTFSDYVLASFTPKETEQIQAGYLDPLAPSSPPPSLASIIRPAVTVYARRGAPILGITVTNRLPESAALIANRYARKYIDYNLDRANTGTNSAIVFLRNQAEDVRAQVEAAEAAMQSYRAKNNLAAMGETQNVVLQKVASLGSALVRAQLDEIDAKSLIDKIEEFQRTKRDLLEIPQIISSGQVSSLNNTHRALQSQRTLLAQNYLDEHPRMRQNALEISETERMLEESIAKAIADLRARHEVATQYVQRLQSEMVATEREVRELDKIAVSYKFLEQDALAKRATHARILDRLNEATISSQLENANIKIFDPAWVPGAPADTGVTEIAVKAGAVALACLLLIPLAVGLLDSRIRTPAQIEESLQQPLLGTVQRIRKMPDSERAQIFRLHKDKALAEAYLGIFSEIEMRSHIDFPKTLLITSSLPAEGKSQLSSNLAAVFASHRRRTLLIDCDLRRPTLHRYFGVKATVGWVQWLETPAAARPAIPPGLVEISEHLHLLPAGPTIENPTELLDQLSRRETLQALVRNYDLVMFDTPPAAVFPDALLLARSCHEMIYVCRFRAVRLPIVRKVLDRFQDSGITLLGVVLNQLPAAKARTYGYHGYGTQSAGYYKAYAEEKTT
jgi:capsular exopolysaccharide synthesis family protein